MPRNIHGATRKAKIGVQGTLPVDQARTLAGERSLRVTGDRELMSITDTVMGLAKSLLGGARGRLADHR